MSQGLHNTQLSHGLKNIKENKRLSQICIISFLYDTRTKDHSLVNGVMIHKPICLFPVHYVM